jgi:hypothetical protein
MVANGGVCDIEEAAVPAVDTPAMYKPDSTWRPSVPSGDKLGAMASCAVGSNGNTFVGTRVGIDPTASDPPLPVYKLYCVCEPPNV